MRRARSEQHDDRGELEEVRGDVAVGVAERLERGDFRALRVHLPVQHHVEDEGRNQQEDRRQHRAEDLVVGVGIVLGEPRKDGLDLCACLVDRSPCR